MIKTIKIEISEKNILKLKEKSSELGYKKIQDYINYILEQILGDDENLEESNYSEETIKEKLREMGYL